MEKIIWKLQCDSPPTALRHCKKCGRKTAFICSKQFRVNAQRRYLDVWLIYKCPHCSTTWNASIASRVSPQSLGQNLLDRFYNNDASLAEQYAMDVKFLRRNGAEAGLPEYTVAGDSFPIGEAVELEIKSKCSLPIKVSSIIRGKLQLSQKDYLKLIDGGMIKSVPEQDLCKCRLNTGISLRFLSHQENHKIFRLINVTKNPLFPRSIGKRSATEKT